MASKRVFRGGFKSPLPNRCQFQRPLMVGLRLKIVTVSAFFCFGGEYPMPPAEIVLNSSTNIFLDLIACMRGSNQAESISHFPSKSYVLNFWSCFVFYVKYDILLLLLFKLIFLLIVANKRIHFLNTNETLSLI